MPEPLTAPNGGAAAREPKSRDVAQPTPAAREPKSRDVAQPTPAAREMKPGDVAQPTPAAREMKPGDVARPTPPAREPKPRDEVQPTPAAREMKPGDVAQPTPAARDASRAYRRRLPHLQPPGATFFVTFNTLRRWQLPDTARDVVLECCVHPNGRMLVLHAAVVMPDHVHLLLTPRRDSDGNWYGLSQILRSIKGVSAHRVNRILRRTGPVWQDEWFDHALRSEESVRGTAAYICENPLRRGLARSESEYQWIWREWIEGAS